MFNIRLEWKSFPLNLNAVDQWMRAHAGDQYRGNSADSRLTLWFENEPEQAIQDEIQAYWDALSETSEEATSYKTAQQLAEEASQAKAQALSSAQAKLAALGLTPAEIAALTG
jgi:hypothetical protein